MSDSKTSKSGGGGESGIRENLPDLEAAFGVEPLPLNLVPPYWLLSGSGLYEWKQSIFVNPTPVQWPPPVPSPFLVPTATSSPSPEPAAPGDAELKSALGPWWWIQREDLRLDVDGRYPQMRVSGTLYNGASLRVHWIADLVKAGSSYTGHIWYKDGTTAALPYTNVTLLVTNSYFTNQRKVTATFTGGGSPTRVRTYLWKSAYFRPVEFEYDRVEGTTTVTVINTGAHPNRPVGMTVENLSIETVFRRAGFNVTKGDDSVIPISAAGANATWSDMEMHDAMQVYWSRFANKPQWSMWVLFAALHDQGTSLGGIMFDDIGPNHRQGTAVFNDSFIKNAPSGDPNPSAWVQRMKFWTACHEMGHSFNLAHSWQKALVFQGKGPWLALANEPEARSFMNYPFNVAGGEGAFFSDFEYRFSDGELLFMRHAPERFVQMGNAEWFDDHGFQGAEVGEGAPLFQLQVRVHRELDYFEFMEPVVVELKLTNVSSEPQIVDENLLRKSDEMTVIIKRRGQPARQWRPVAQNCYQSAKTMLAPGESRYGSLYLATSPSGWEISEPGVYTVQVALHRADEDVVSNELRIRVAPARSYEEEFVAQDFFSEDVGRTLALNGSRFLERANDTLREVAERFADRRVAQHAHLALGNPLTRDYKLLVVDDGQLETTAHEDADKHIEVLGAKPDAAREQMSDALTESPSEAAETFGHIDYRLMVEQYSAFLADAGDSAAAAASIGDAKKTLAARNVLASVVQDLETTRKRYTSSKSGKARPPKKK